jgi:hypothetical protein
MNGAGTEETNQPTFTPEQEAAAKELVTKLATVCREYEPGLVLFVLEACLSEELARISPVIGMMFDGYMREFKKRSSLILNVMEALEKTVERQET